MSKITNLTASVAVLSASLVFATAANAVEIYEPSAQNEAFVACFGEKPEISSEEINQRISEVMQQKMANGEGLSGLLSDAMNSFYKQYQIDCAEQTGMDVEEVEAKMAETERRNAESLQNGQGQGMVELFRPVIR